MDRRMYIRLFCGLTLLFAFTAFILFVAAVWAAPHTALKGELGATGGLMVIPAALSAFAWAVTADTKDE